MRSPRIKIDIPTMEDLTPIAAANFWARVERRSDSECWPWKGAILSTGYPVFQFAGKLRKATRMSIFISTGEFPPDGLLACHTCDNPPCVNPAHLWLGTHQDNMRDRAAKGTRWKPHSSGPAAATHCKNGHEFAPENLAPNSGKRRCRTCLREYGKAYARKARARKMEKVDGLYEAYETACQDARISL